VAPRSSSLLPRSSPLPSLIARAPTRIDFGGGWTDVPPFPADEGGYVCNVAIARHATARLRAARPGDAGGGGSGGEGREGDDALARAALRRAGLTDVALTLESDFPVGAGLGGSSAAGIAVAGALAAWRGLHPSRAELAEESRAVEVEDLGVAGGRQDHYAAAFGGALGLRFGSAVEVERIPLGAAAAELERRCVVGYTGQSRISGRTITGVIDAYRRREPRVTEALRRMRALAEQMAAALRRGSVDDLGALVGEHWAHQRALHPEITTERIDAIVERTTAAGALGVKALGASGGGCVLAVAASGREAEVRAAMAALAEPLAFGVDERGLDVEWTER